MRKIIYEPHPVSAQRKAELKSRGYIIIDEIYRCVVESEGAAAEARRIAEAKREEEAERRRERANEWLRANARHPDHPLS